MADVYTQRLGQASWRGIVFSVRSEDLPTGGRKTALHDFPNSDQRFVEDLGEIPPRFTITAFVHGLDWLERAQALENALREPGPGRLVMPTFGAYTVWSLPYSKRASQTSVGEIEFTLEFATSRAVAGIIESAPVPELVFAAGDTARGSIADAFASLFESPGDSVGFGAALYDISSAANGVATSVSNLLGAESLSELTSAIRDVIGNAGPLLQDPIQLALEFFGVEDAAPGLWQIISEGLDSLSSVGILLDFANQFGNNLALIRTDIDSGATVAPVSDISLWPATTPARIDRNQARSVIVESNRLGALVSAYEQAANADYQTTDQVQTIRTDLEDTFAEMMRVDAQEVNSVPANRNVRAAMDEVRIRALSVLDQKAQSAWLISQISRVSGISSPGLAYLLYAEALTDSESLDARAVQVRQLNLEKPAIALNGQLNVLRGRNA